MTGFLWVIVLGVIVLTGAAILASPAAPMGLDDWGQPDADEGEGWR